MKKWLTVVLIALLAVAAGCGSRTSSETPEPSQGEGQPQTEPDASFSKSFTVVTSSEYAIDDLAKMVTWETLRSQGWQVEELILAKNELAVSALAQGEADIGGLVVNLAIDSKEKGVPIKSIYQEKGNQWVLVAKKEIATPADLAGKRVGIHGENSLSNSLVSWTAKKYGIELSDKPVIPGSSVRAQAMIQGQIDATVIDIASTIELLERAPNDFHRLIVYSKDAPEIMGSMTVAREDWLQENPETAAAVVKALIETAARAKQDPEWMIEQAKKHFPETEDATIEKIVREMIDSSLWDSEGTLTFEQMKATMDFFVEAGDLPETVSDPAKFVDLTPLEQAKQ